MIKIYLKKGNQYYTGLKITGHAPSLFGKKGENILCAGVSVLVQTLYLYLKEKGNILTEEVKKGYLDFSILSSGEETQKSFDLILTGIRDLKTQYPEFIEIN